MAPNGIGAISRHEYLLGALADPAQGAQGVRNIRECAGIVRLTVAELDDRSRGYGGKTCENGNTLRFVQAYASMRDSMRTHTPRCAVMRNYAP